MSKRGSGSKRKKRGKAKAPAGVSKPKSSGVDVFDRARKIGMIMDPTTETTPEDIGRTTDEMVKLHLLEPIVVLSGEVPREGHGPTKEFLDMFLGVRKEMLERAENKEEAAAVTSKALAMTVRDILELEQPNVDEAVLMAKSMDYYIVMAMYMSMPGMHERLGIDGWDFFPPSYKQDAMERRAREED